MMDAGRYDVRPTGEESEDRISVTGVDGTVARFEMAYNAPLALEKKFPLPAKTGIFEYAYAVLTALFFLVVAVAQWAPVDSPLHAWLYERDVGRPVASFTLAGVILASGVAALVRARMRGVVVSAEGIELRDSFLGFPRVRAWVWSQVYRMVLDDEGHVLLELWDRRYERLPQVVGGAQLTRLMQAHAARHHIAVTYVP